MQVTERKLKTGGYWIKGVKTWVEDGRLFFQFPFNKNLQLEIKSMRGARYHGYDEVNPRKLWSIDICQRNTFQLDFMEGKPVYENYDKEITLLDLKPRWNLSKQKLVPPLVHQPEMAGHIYTRKRCIVAGEMGTTKTYCLIAAAEKLSAEFQDKYGQIPEIWYVAPRSALRAVQREFRIWDSPLHPVFMTYEELVKRVKNWEPGTKAPAFIVYDESSKIKTPTSQRTQAAQAMADAVRSDWGEDAVVVLMTGSPAPKSPSDWWSQCEVACPGFLKEGDIYKFNNRLGIIVKKENFTGGGVYPSLVTWRDDENKCNICGKFADDPIHNTEVGDLVGDPTSAPHTFFKSVNEVAFLYKRLQGLVYVKFKKDCLDLPEKNYREIELKPSPSLERAARIIVKSAKTTIEGLTLLRELSDGFQYTDVKEGKMECPRCQGSKTATEYLEVPNTCPNCKGAPDDFECHTHLPERTETEVPCPHCGATGEVDKIVRTTKEVSSPKEQALIDLLDEYEDIGRVVIYAGFTAAIDKCVRICQKQGWKVIRIDQGKEQTLSETGEPLGIDDYVSLFQDRREEFSRVAFVAHPGSAGMGLTLTASPVIIYYSNDFNGESRIQSEDRIHRPGMDYNLGATIIDLIHLPSDRKVLVNLQQKRDLQAMTLGELLEQADGGTETRGA